MPFRIGRRRAALQAKLAQRIDADRRLLLLQFALVHGGWRLQSLNRSQCLGWQVLAHVRTRSAPVHRLIRVPVGSVPGPLAALLAAWLATVAHLLVIRYLADHFPLLLGHAGGRVNRAPTSYATCVWYWATGHQSRQRACEPRPYIICNLCMVLGNAPLQLYHPSMNPQHRRDRIYPVRRFIAVYVLMAV